MSASRSPYIPALDGLRAMSILLVLVAHLIGERVAPGGFGVTLFFFISGYLISQQLIAEIQKSGHLDFKNFYIRRFLRLMPASLVYIIVGGVLFLAVGGVITLGGWIAALLYGGNYYDLYVAYVSAANGVRHPFDIIWSLAVEEHFYLLWPAILALFLTRAPAKILYLVLATCLVELLWRAFLFDRCMAHGMVADSFCGVNPFYRLYKATDTRLDSIAWGALLAVYPLSKSGLALERMTQGRLVRILASIGLLLSFALRDNYFREVVRYTLQGVCLVVLVPYILQLDIANPTRRLLESRPALFIGRLSYSIYLWHWLAAGVADEVFHQDHPLAWSLLAISLTGPLSLLSYYRIERPMLSLRRRFGSNAPDMPSAPGPAV